MPRLSLTMFLGMLFLITLIGCSRSEVDTSAKNSMDTSATAVEGSVIARGEFVDKGGQHTSGSYTIERIGGDLQLILGDDFRTDEGPDLHVVLTPTMVTDANNDNAMVEGAEIVGALALQGGKQVYDLRDDLRVDQFHSVVIHCIEYSHLYGAASVQ